MCEFKCEISLGVKLLLNDQRTIVNEDKYTILCLALRKVDSEEDLHRCCFTVKMSTSTPELINSNFVMIQLLIKFVKISKKLLLVLSCF